MRRRPPKVDAPVGVADFPFEAFCGYGFIDFEDLALRQLTVGGEVEKVLFVEASEIPSDIS